jgi:hypothetical protein
MMTSWICTEEEVEADQKENVEKRLMICMVKIPIIVSNISLILIIIILKYQAIVHSILNTTTLFKLLFPNHIQRLL